MIKILEYGKIDKSEIFSRGADPVDVSDTVRDIIKNVKENKDLALRFYAEKFDGVILDDLEVTKSEIEEAFSLVDKQLIETIESSERNIRFFHEKQKREGFTLQKENGVILGQKITAIENVGLYVPGGTAAYPSTVLMDAVPAKIAGCKQIIMVTPPMKNGKINPAILVAAKTAGVDRIFKISGAQAIAGLAYGTESVPKVDKIVGPGNIFVAEAKRQVFGLVAIDVIAGPSEILIVADETCNPKHIACDLLSQAEHDKRASAVLVTDSMEFAKNVQREIEEQLKELSRQDIARVSIDTNGKIIVTDDIKTAIEISNAVAPEHLELCLDNPFDYLDDVKHAGSIFLGKNCPEALGDYFAGPNHTLPTNGTARFSSPLSVDDFVKKSQFIYYTEQALATDCKQVERFANAEGLTAHAKSATVRTEK